MGTSKTAKAKQAIDDAQEALQAAEDALTSDSRKARADAVIEAITSYDRPDAGDAPIGAAAELAAASTEKPTGECVAFSVADALIRLGLDSQFSSAHAIHRTMIGVMFHPDGTVSAGAFIEERPEEFDRYAAGMLAITNAGGAIPAKPGQSRKLFGG